MQEIFYDRLYGPIFLSKVDVELLKQPKIVRSRKVSLSAVPSHLTNFSTHADRCEHGIGTGHLANQLPPEFDGFRSLIHRAAFLHDVGHPPFSHTSEPYLKEICHKTHEEIIGETLLDKEIRRIILTEGLDPGDVLEMIVGEFPLIGKVLNGSIDLDNLDNTLRYGLSGGMANTVPYFPQRLAQAFRIINGRVALHSHCQFELKNWKNLRDGVYAMIYDDANLRGGMMLQRAIDLSFQENHLPADFFLLTDDTALSFLCEKTSDRSKKLIENTLKRNFYETIFSLELKTPSSSPEARDYFGNWRGRNKLADDICKQCGLEPEDLCAFVGISKGPKSITLPFWNEENGFTEQPFEKVDNIYLVKVYLNSKAQDQANQIRSMLKNLFSSDI